MDKQEHYIIFLIVLISMLIGLAIGMVVSEHNWRVDSIKQEFAEYDSTTGQWQWKKNIEIVEKK